MTTNSWIWRPAEPTGQMPTARAETVLSLNRQMRRIPAMWSTAFPCFARCSRPLQLVDLVALVYVCVCVLCYDSSIFICIFGLNSIKDNDV